jgi:hypothetical protein
MSGVHHAYNRLGRQKQGPRYNPFKRGPRHPHRHKANHGHWEANPNSTGKHDRYIWVHKEGFEAPFVQTPLSERPVVQVATEIVRNAVRGGSPMMNPAPTTTQKQGFPLPLLAIAVLFLIK